jgi:hypothetical protein
MKTILVKRKAGQHLVEAIDHMILQSCDFRFDHLSGIATITNWYYENERASTENPGGFRVKDRDISKAQNIVVTLPECLVHDYIDSYRPKEKDMKGWTKKMKKSVVR